jgi:hypothetical protein
VSVLNSRADDVCARAAAVQMPQLSTILVTLVGLIPFLLGWILNVLWQLARLLIAAFQSGWEAGPAKPARLKVRRPGGS